MADLATLERALRNADAAGDTAAATQLAAAYRAAQVAQKPAPQEGLGSAIDHYAGGIEQGLFDLPQKAVELGARGLDATGLTDHSYDNVHGAFSDMNDIATPGLHDNKYAQGGRVVGDVIGATPLAGVAPLSGGGMLATTGNAILQGGMTGLLDSAPGTAPESTVEGSAIAGGLNAVTHGLASVIAPLVRPAVQRLRDAAVTMTPGQIFGGATKGLEDRLAGFPLIGDLIRGAQRGSIREFNTAAGNEAMSPLGAAMIPPGTFGHEMSTLAHDTMSDNYNRILPQMDVTLGAPLSTAIGDATTRLAARQPAGVSEQFGSALDDIFKKLEPSPGMTPSTYTGDSIKNVFSDLGAEARANITPQAGANDRALGGAYNDVNSALRGSFQSADPVLASELSNTDAAFRRMIPVHNAIAGAPGNAGGTPAGVFSPQQLRRAVVSGDRSVRRTATAQGRVPLQQLAEDGIEVLPSSVPDSGTAGRAGIAALLMDPSTWGTALTVGVPTAAAYSRPGLAAINAIFARQAGPGATMLGNLVRTLGTLGAPGAGGVGPQLFNGGPK